MGVLVRWLKGILAAAAAAAALLALAPSSGAVTVGPPLNAGPNSSEGCELLVLRPLRQTIGVPPSCTFFSAQAQTPPGNYVVTTGRLRTGPRTGPMVFTAVRAMRSKATVNGMPAGVICCTSEAESQVFTPSPNTLVEVPMQLPMQNTTTLIDGEQVEVIDYLGITLLDLRASAPVIVGGQTLSSFFAPALRAGGQQLMNGFQGAVLINGEFAPCGVRTSSARASTVPGCPGGPGSPGGGGGGGAAGGGGGDGGSGDNAGRNRGFQIGARVVLRRNGTVARLAIRAPRAGVIRVQPNRRARNLLAVTRTRASRGVNRVAVRLTRRGRLALKRRGRLPAPVTVTFRPRDGKAQRQSKRIVFKR